MGEAHALKYVEANISPSVLYGTELVREVGAAEKLDNVKATEREVVQLDLSKVNQRK